MKRLFVGALTALVFGIAPPAQAETVFNYSSWIPWTHQVNETIYIPWMEAVEEATDGRVRFRRLPSAVASPRAHLDAVRTGQADAAMSVADYSPRRFAAYQFAQLPFLGERAVNTSIALWRTHERFFADRDFFEGVHLIGLNTHGPGLIHHREKFILSPADMEGQKMRTGGPIPRAIVEAWGGVAIRQPAPQSYELLSQGVVDGITFPWESLPSFNITELVPYSTNIPGGMYSSAHYLVISADKWEELSDEDKAAIDELSGEAFARHAGEGWDKLNDEGRETALEAGNEIREASEAAVESIRELNERFEAEYVEQAETVDVDGRAVLDFFRAEVEKLANE